MTPAATEKAVGIAERLYEARRTMRWLLGDRYAVSVGPPRAILAGLADEHGGVLGALHVLLIDLRRAPGESAGLGSLLMAAAAELLEPDALTPPAEVTT